VERHGFNIVAVEADWPDAGRMFDRFVRGPARGVRARKRPFQRFPTWMWRNEEADALIRWLREYNEQKSGQGWPGFYGLDLYNLHGSIRAVIDYLDDVDPGRGAGGAQALRLPGTLIAATRRSMARSR
jgi:erythromycin esterase-like protein